MNADSKISVLAAAALIVTALFFDLIQFLLTFLVIGFLVNWIVSLWAYLTFWLWLTLKGLSFMKRGRVFYLAGGFLIELIPGLNALPGWTVAVVSLVASVWFEENAERVLKLAGAAEATVQKFKTLAGKKE